MFIIA